MFSDHRINLEISNRKTSRKSPKIWKPNNIPLNNLSFKKEIKREIHILDRMKMKI